MSALFIDVLYIFFLSFFFSFLQISQSSFYFLNMRINVYTNGRHKLQPDESQQFTPINIYLDVYKVLIIFHSE